MQNLVKTIRTIGLSIELPNGKFSITKIRFDRFDDETVRVCAESGRNGSELKVIAPKMITRAELQDLPDDQYDDLVFARAAFRMMGLSIG